MPASSLQHASLQHLRQRALQLFNLISHLIMYSSSMIPLWLSSTALSYLLFLNYLPIMRIFV